MVERFRVHLENHDCTFNGAEMIFHNLVSFNMLELARQKSRQKLMKYLVLVYFFLALGILLLFPPQ